MVEKENKPKAKKAAKKSFFEVRAPLTSSKISLYAGSEEELEGKTVIIDLTKSLRGKSLQLKLKIVSGENGLEGNPIELLLVGSYIRKIFRGGIDYVEDSFDAECRDAVVKIKPFLMTRNKVSRAVRKELRNLAKKTLEAYLKTRTAKEIFLEIITNKLQKVLSTRLRKVYPLALCEIRVFSLIREKEAGKEEAKAEEVQEEPAEEKKE